MEHDNTQPHKRRVRYKGTHPRKFEEKYKELNPEKYADTVAKVISNGRNAYFNLCEGNSGFFADSARAEGAGCNTGIWWS